MSEETKNNQTDDLQKFIEDPEVLQEQLGRTEKFARQNSKLLSGILTVALVVIALGVTYKWYIGEQDKAAQNELFPAVFYFEKGEYDKAIDGDGVSIGLLAIKEQYSGTNAANLSSFYAGVSYYQKGDYDAAISQMDSYSGSDLLTQAQAFAVIGDAYMQKEDYANAANYYDKAASTNPNEQITDIYLEKSALAHELNKDYSAALNAYEDIIEKYGDSQSKAKAEKSKAKMQQYLQQ